MKVTTECVQDELFPAVDPASLDLSVGTPVPAAEIASAARAAEVGETPDPAAERRAELLVETMGWSPARAAAVTGLAEVAAGQVPGTARWRGARQVPARRRSGHGAQYGEEAGVGYPGGRPWELQDRKPLTEDERARLTRGVELARAVLATKGILR
ncbi:MAG TPA: hypothetical protein VLH86_01855 [Patescibacteria group bacterium]|nr:hypothetical protein [Patescibacteria group bacterium]